MSLGMSPRACPCGATSYDEPGGPPLGGEGKPATPEELMRSRYSAYAVGDTDYVWRTWHPRTRPEQVTSDPATRWIRLEIIDASEDTVEFRAHHDSGILHELSRFEQRGSRWFY